MRNQNPYKVGRSYSINTNPYQIANNARFLIAKHRKNRQMPSISNATSQESTDAINMQSNKSKIMQNINLLNQTYSKSSSDINMIQTQHKPIDSWCCKCCQLANISQTKSKCLRCNCSKMDSLDTPDVQNEFIVVGYTRNFKDISDDIIYIIRTFLSFQKVIH